jgi:hypothetical protein
MGEGEALVLFGRLPVEGRVKTRLAAGSNAAAACSFYRSCCEHLLRETGRVNGARRVFFCSEQAQRTPVVQWVCAIDPVRGQSTLRAAVRGCLDAAPGGGLGLRTLHRHRTA